VVFTTLSPLARGADSIVVEEALDLLSTAGVVLEAVLPLSIEAYLKDDFKTLESRKRFRDLLRKADRRVSLAERGLTPEQAYERAGRYVVDHCDVLIAVWDGQAARGRGGTAEVVDYARFQEVPVLVVPIGDADRQGSHQGGDADESRVERQFSATRTALRRVDAYNRAAIDEERFQARISDIDERLGGLCDGTSVHWGCAGPRSTRSHCTRASYARFSCADGSSTKSSTTTSQRDVASGRARRTSD
jgi:hypothetical protein